MTKFSFHQKWNETWLLVINRYVRVPSGIAKRLKNYHISKLGNIRKLSKLHIMNALCLAFPPKWKFCQCYQKAPEKWKLNFSRNEPFQVKTKVCLKYFVNDCLWKQALASNSPPDLIKFDFFDSFWNSKAFDTVLS